MPLPGFEPGTLRLQARRLAHWAQALRCCSKGPYLKEDPETSFRAPKRKVPGWNPGSGVFTQKREKPREIKNQPEKI
jgi:hypothetical protein